MSLFHLWRACGWIFTTLKTSRHPTYHCIGLMLKEWPLRLCEEPRKFSFTLTVVALCVIQLISGVCVSDSCVLFHTHESLLGSHWNNLNVNVTVQIQFTLDTCHCHGNEYELLVCSIYVSCMLCNLMMTFMQSLNGTPPVCAYSTWSLCINCFQHLKNKAGVWEVCAISLACVVALMERVTLYMCLNCL